MDQNTFEVNIPGVSIFHVTSLLESASVGFTGGEAAFRSIGNVSIMNGCSVGLDLNQSKLNPLEAHIM